MHWRLVDIPVFERKECELPANIYNTIHLGNIRFRHEFRFEPEGLRSLDLILDDRDWIVVDRDLNDLPVIAWTDFQTKGRDNLHLPVKCTLLYYHAHADKIEKTVLDYAFNKISELIKKRSPGH